MTSSRRVDPAAARIAVDLGPVRDRPTGVGVYAASLAGALVQTMPERLILLGRRPEAPLDGSLAAATGSVAFRGRNYHEWLHRHAEGDARRSRAQLVHYTNASAPLSARLPFVLTVHDLSLLRFPLFHPLLRLATVPFMLAAIARARTIIVPSDATRRELRRVLRVADRRVVVVEHASPTAEPGEPPAEVLPRYGLRPHEYLVVVGTIEPRKNHARLLAAFEQVAAARPQLRLVIAGPTGWRSAGTLRRIEASPLRDRVILTGYLPDARMATLVAHAAALCYVSLYEGYGLPIIEAMALGAPVITSSVSAMPQTAGGAAVLVDPLSTAAIAGGIESALQRRESLAAAGRARAAGRTWADVAAETRDVYEWALRRQA